MLSLREWETFYVIVGSSAAALTGLQFVVMALITDRKAPADMGGIDAFGTPTIVHFSTALVVSAILTAPWRTAAGPAILLGALGAFGLIYSIVVARRARQQTEYKPVFEDWVYHVVLPAAAYLTIAVAASVIRVNDSPGLFALGAAVLLLLLIGVHNTWDSVRYIVVVRR